MSGWNTSPIDEIIQDSLELSDGLKVDNGVLKCAGNDGGFIDEFDTLDPRWDTVNNASIIDGKMVFDTTPFTNTAWSTRYNNTFINASGEYVDLSIKHAVICKFTVYGNAGVFVGYYDGTYPSPMFNIKLDNKYVYTRFGGYISSFLPEILKNVDMSASNAKQDVYIKLEATNYPYIHMSISLDGETWEYCDTQFNDSRKYLTQLRIGIYYPNTRATDYPNTSAELHYCKVLGYPTSETATLPESEVYTAQLPAKLAYVSSVAPTFVSAGNGGKVNFLVQRKSDWDDEWTSLSGELSGWTDLGELADGVKLSFPEYFSGPNEKLRYKLIYTGSGLDSYPEISKFTFEWQSDVTAPDDPEITVATSAANSVAVITFKEIPADAYAIKFDLKVNDSSFLPFSERGKLETGYGYMRFVGPKESKENASERNTLTVAIDGLVSGDIVTPRIYAIDQQENQSAGLIGTPIEITSAKYYPKLADKWSGRWPDLSWKGRWID